MKIGLCLAPETASSWPSFPGDYMEVNVQRELLPEASAEVFAASARSLRALGFPVLAANCFLPSDLRVVGPAVDAPRLIRYALAAFSRARAVGLRHIVFGSGGARRVPDGWSHAAALDQFIAALRLFGPLAADHDITLVVEPLNRAECNLLNTVAEGALAVARADHPRVRLLADLYHMARNQESPAALREAGPLIAHAHIAEVAARTPPGVAGDDFRPYLQALCETGYAGALSIECIWGPDPLAEAVAAVGELRRQLADVARDPHEAPIASRP